MSEDAKPRRGVTRRGFLRIAGGGALAATTPEGAAMLVEAAAKTAAAAAVPALTGAAITMAASEVEKISEASTYATGRLSDMKYIMANKDMSVSLRLKDMKQFWQLALPRIEDVARQVQAIHDAHPVLHAQIEQYNRQMASEYSRALAEKAAVIHKNLHAARRWGTLPDELKTYIEKIEQGDLPRSLGELKTKEAELQLKIRVQNVGMEWEDILDTRADAAIMNRIRYDIPPLAGLSIEENNELEALLRNLSGGGIGVSSNIGTRMAGKTLEYIEIEPAALVRELSEAVQQRTIIMLMRQGQEITPKLREQIRDAFPVSPLTPAEHIPADPEAARWYLAEKRRDLTPTQLVQATSEPETLPWVVNGRSL